MLFGTKQRLFCYDCQCEVRWATKCCYTFHLMLTLNGICMLILSRKMELYWKKTNTKMKSFSRKPSLKGKPSIFLIGS
jgi:hypothetical protein